MRNAVRVAKTGSQSMEQSEHGTRGGENDIPSFNHSTHARCRMGSIWAGEEEEHVEVHRAVLADSDGEKLCRFDEVVEMTKLETFDNKQTKWEGLWWHGEYNGFSSATIDLSALKQFKGKVRLYVRKNKFYENGKNRRPNYFFA